MPKKRSNNALYWKKVRDYERNLLADGLRTGKTIRQLSKEFGVSPNFMSQKLLALGISSDDRQRMVDDLKLQEPVTSLVTASSTEMPSFSADALNPPNFDDWDPHQQKIMGAFRKMSEAWQLWGEGKREFIELTRGMTTTSLIDVTAHVNALSRGDTLPEQPRASQRRLSDKPNGQVFLDKQTSTKISAQDIRKYTGVSPNSTGNYTYPEKLALLNFNSTLSRADKALLRELYSVNQHAFKHWRKTINRRDRIATENPSVAKGSSSSRLPKKAKVRSWEQNSAGVQLRKNAEPADLSLEAARSERALKFLLAHPNGVVISELTEPVGATYYTVHRVLEGLKKAKKVVSKVGKTHNNGRATYYYPVKKGSRQ